MFRFALLALVAAHPLPITLPVSYQTTFRLRTNAAELGEVSADAIDASIDYRTDGTSWRASFYNGLQLELHVPKGNFKQVYQNGKRTCIVSAPDPTWEKIQVLPTDIDTYEYVGNVILRNLLVEKWKAPVPLNQTSLEGFKSGLFFYYDRSTETPVRWSIIRGRNPVFNSHTDLWNVDYQAFSRDKHCGLVFDPPEDCHTAVISPSLVLGGAFPRGLKKRAKKNLRTPSNWSPPEIDVPEKYDWHEQGFAGPVKDQGFCGSCWAFSMASTIASKYAIQQFRRGQEVDFPLLSEQRILDCGWTNQSHACDGGEFDDQELFGAGFSLSSHYGGYLSADGRCHDAQVFLKVKEWIIVAMHRLTKNEQDLAIQRALFSEGPLSINILCTPTLLLYRRGVLDDPLCENVAADDTDHAVVLVGYGTHVLPYWKVKNSWSVAWGENGYIRISRRRNCGISTHPGFPQLQQWTPEEEKEREIQN
eukprot:GEMP01030391.1.p1 GENE.GEMP01030391.1~~GEMP01030391.1.p1  ORF type:complete len:476 (+),score=66.63 GEMP01030391.1:164-1591(+)